MTVLDGELLVPEGLIDALQRKTSLRLKAYGTDRTTLRSDIQTRERARSEAEALVMELSRSSTEINLSLALRLRESGSRLADATEIGSLKIYNPAILNGFQPSNEWEEAILALEAKQRGALNGLLTAVQYDRNRPPLTSAGLIRDSQYQHLTYRRGVNIKGATFLLCMLDPQEGGSR